MKTLSSLVFSILMVGFLHAQTSNIDLGCSPLTVQFTAPAGQATHYWNFENGSQSMEANPSAIFTAAGSYEVALFESMGGNLVGTVTITVLEEPQIMIAVESIADCAPFIVDFLNESILPEELTNVSYNWTFGDGTAMQGENVSHTYTSPGVYDLSVRMTSDLEGCNQDVPFEDFITVLPALNDPNFAASPTSACNVPTTVFFNNFTTHEAGYTYSWDFGNGTTSTDQHPTNQTYTEAGVYEVVLTLSNPQGCTEEFSQTLTFGDGPPVIDLVLPDSICAGAPYTFINNTDPTSFTWIFEGGDIIASSSPNPTITYDEAGTFSVNLMAGAGTCSSNIDFTVHVYKPDASFSLSPDFLCETPAEVDLQANTTTYETYVWSEDETVNESNLAFTFDEPDRDSFYIDTLELYIYTLAVTDEFGCVAEETNALALHGPWAHFKINRSRGCAPLMISFSDSSTSVSNIVSWTWDFDDGTVIDVANNSDQNHTYIDPGVYYPRLIVENENGCIDTSDAVRIEVGDTIEGLEFEVDPGQICLDDSVHIAAVTIDDRIDAWHFNTDSDRSFHCFNESELDHVFFTETGSFDMTMTVEYNGCYSSVTQTEQIEVLGPLARIEYMQVCESPYEVMLMNASEQAVVSTWYIPGQDTLDGVDLTYTFPDRGSYQIFLEAENAGTGCPNRLDSVEIVISDIMASFPLEERYCVGDSIFIDASASLGVNNTCFKGYTWTLPGLPRPRTIPNDGIGYTMAGQGVQPFTLVVEDVNGCTDTLTQTATLYKLEADFEMDKDLICIPMEVNFTDQSLGDTTITDWQWTFGATDPDPSFVFTAGQDNISVSLEITDELGCIATASEVIQVYEPISIIDVLPQNAICLGDSIHLTATDFTTQGSFLNFNWNFGNGQTSIEQNPNIYYENAGIYELTLSIEEDATGCQNEIMETINVLEIPVADFSTSVDGLDVRCAGQVAFTNLSQPAGDYTWTFTNEDGEIVASTTSEPNPVFFFDKGITNIQLIAANALGCGDTIVKQIDLAAPEGDFMVTDDLVCLGETITFTAIDLVDVTSFLWGFGDGTIVENTNPVNHQYSFAPEDGINTAQLIMYTGDEACETVVEIPIAINEVIADFEASEVDPSDCSVSFFDASIGAAQYQWDFGDQSTSADMDPVHIFELPAGTTSETFVVQLIVTDENNLCQDTTLQTIIIEIDLANIQMPNAFTPNGEEPNDFFNFVVVDGGINSDITVNKFQIFNRWGQRVYDNDTPDTGWDGMIGRQEAPEAVYAFVIELELKQGIIWEKQGNVTLMRP